MSCDNPVARHGPVLVQDRADLAPSLAMLLAHTFSTPTPVTRERLLRDALAVWAPAEILLSIQALPERTFRSATEVTQALVLVEEVDE